MKHPFICAFLAAVALSASAGVPDSQAAYAARTHADFEARLETLGDSSLTRFFSRELTPDERQALEFLYAYMPLADVMNESPEYYLENVQAALRARREMPWGSLVPEREFRHFVLPTRVNNEALDGSRSVFYDELRPRVQGLSMKDAILEVNHWLHEKVTYQPSDGRTSSPLSSVSQAIGRCGEESTFGVAALRSIGIPARQVYTPRWAHTDDNHAWVEAWADGQWWFLGACEPEPILNLAWFNAPASRGMLMNTNAYGRYDGPEEQIGRTSVATNINVTSNYAQVAPVTVVVKDAAGRPVEGAEVGFCLYNYSEYYPLARKLTGKDGRAELLCGKGDLVVWADDGSRFGLAKANFSEPVVVTLDKDGSFAGAMEFDLVPPAQAATLPSPTEAQVAENDRRKSVEDSIRGAYTASFATAEDGRRLAAELGLDADLMARLMPESRGNHKAIEALLRNEQGLRRQRALLMLMSMSEKDRRDVPMQVVTERLELPGSDSPLYADYILNPRVEYEALRPFVGAFRPDQAEEFRRNPALWEAWVADSIAIDSKWNPGRLRMDPAAVWKWRRADRPGRDIFFVSGARVLGIPARIDQVTGKPQWHDGAEWHDAFREAASGSKAPQGKVKFSYTPVGRTADPAYYSNFSISKIEGGFPKLLDFDENITLSAMPEDFDAGQYLLTTGQRMADGSVLARSEFFTVREGETVEVPVAIRQSESAVQVIGAFNSEDRYRDPQGTVRSLLSTTGRGYYTLIYGRPNHEPTAHVLNDLRASAKEFEADGRKIVLLYGSDEELRRADVANRFAGLPANVALGTDIDGKILSELTENLGLTPGNLPIVVVADTFNRVVYVSEGYTIGSDKRLLDTLHRLE